MYFISEPTIRKNEIVYEEIRPIADNIKLGKYYSFNHNFKKR